MMDNYREQFKPWRFGKVAQTDWDLGTFKQLKQSALEPDFFIQFMLWGY